MDDGLFVLKSGIITNFSIRKKVRQLYEKNDFGNLLLKLSGRN